MTSREIAALVAEASPLLEGAVVDDIHQSDEHVVFVTFYGPASGKLFLLVSTRPGLSRFHLVEDRPPALPLPPPFCEAARKHLKGSRLKSLRQVGGDRVGEFFFRRKSGEASVLVLEMTREKGELILTIEEGKLKGEHRLQKQKK